MDEALYKVAVTYLIEEETDQAAKYFQQLVRDYPNSDYVENRKNNCSLSARQFLRQIPSE
jgi:TolA-binding protein